VCEAVECLPLAQEKGQMAGCCGKDTYRRFT